MTTSFATRTETTAQCIRSAMDLELRVGRLYLEMAARSEGQPWLRDLLRGLAAEEDQHAKRIRLLERTRTGAGWGNAELEAVGIGLRRAHGVIDEMEASVASGRIARGGAIAACETILSIERTLGALHAEMIAGALAPEVRNLFETLAKQDAHHQAVARDAMKAA